MGLAVHGDVLCVHDAIEDRLGDDGMGKREYQSASDLLTVMIKLFLIFSVTKP